MCIEKFKTLTTCQVLLLLLISLFPFVMMPVELVFADVIFQDNFTGQLTWIASDPNSVYIKDNDFLFIGTNGKYDDYAYHTFSIPLSVNVPLTIEQRTKLQSGGLNYLLPWELIYFEDNSDNTRLDVTFAANGEGGPCGINCGWYFGPQAPFAFTENKNSGVPGEDYWAVTRIVLSSTQAQLYVKPDDATKGWFSDSFSFVASASYSHSRIIKIEFQQPWDSVDYVDYITISTPAGTTTTTYQPQTASQTVEVVTTQGASQTASVSQQATVAQSAFTSTSDVLIFIGIALGLLVSIPIVIFRSRRLRRSS
jgi:hypothetical protein